MNSKKKKISFVVPVYNEESNLFLLYEKLQAVFLKYSEKYLCEAIFINDGSKDASWKIIKNFSEKDSRIKGISFSRNFGHQLALTAGYDRAQGDAIISLDADLQDPPELVEAMVSKWEDGTAIVYARRSSRSD